MCYCFFFFYNQEGFGGLLFGFLIVLPDSHTGESLKETYYAISLFPLRLVLKVKKVKVGRGRTSSVPQKTQLPETSSVVPPFFPWLCDITLVSPCHTHLFDLAALLPGQEETGAKTMLAADRQRQNTGQWEIWCVLWALKPRKWA